MSLKTRILLSAAVGVLALTACGGGGGGGSSSGGSNPPPVADTTAPSVSFSPATLTVKSGETGTSTLSATDNVGVTSGPTVTCTNSGSFAGSTFTAPDVTAETTSVCTATASDAAGNSGSATLNVTVTPPETVIFEGHVVKGPISGAAISITDAENPIDDADAVIVTGATDNDGSFSLTIPEETSLSNMLVVSALLAEAQMICDAANCLSEGGVNFGDPILIPVDEPGAVKFLSAAVPTPDAFGVSTVNVNMFSHYQLLDMLGISLARQGAGASLTIDQQDYAATRQSTATIFGLPDADFFSIPFVDITQPITSTDQNAIYAALLSGGLLGAALEADDPFAAIFDFQNRAAQDNLIARESFDDRNMISLWDIFDNARVLGGQIDNNGNAFSSATSAVNDKVVELVSVPADRPINADGSFPEISSNLSFVEDSLTFLAVEESYVVKINNPDRLTYTAQVVEGPNSSLFGVLDLGWEDLQLDIGNFGNPVPTGTFTLQVTFDPEPGDPFTDSIEINLTEANLSVVEPTITISKAATDRAVFTLDNQSNFLVDFASIEGAGSEFFFSEVKDSSELEIIMDALSLPPNGTYEFTVTLSATVPGGTLPNDYTDIIEVIVEP